MLPNPNDEFKNKMRLLALFAGLLLYVVVVSALYRYAFSPME